MFGAHLLLALAWSEVSTYIAETMVAREFGANVLVHVMLRYDFAMLWGWGLELEFSIKERTFLRCCAGKSLC